MKKILAVLLAVMMLFGAVSMNAAAVIDDTSAYSGYYEMTDVYGNSVVDSNSQTIIIFDLNGGTLKNNVWVFDTNTLNFVNVQGSSVENPYIMLPRTPESQRVGNAIPLPTVTPPEGYQFDGWWGTGTNAGNTYAANGSYTIKAGDIGDVVVFTAGYSPAEIEADTLDTVLGILIKVFGAIIGIVLYSGNTEAGVAMMEKVLGGLF